MDPAARLTAEHALAHPFFRLYQKEDVRLFSPRKTFRVSHNIDLAFFMAASLTFKVLEKRNPTFSSAILPVCLLRC